jgi:hypothetical protein
VWSIKWFGENFEYNENEKEHQNSFSYFLAVPYKFHNAFFWNLPPVADSESFYPIRVQKLKHRIFAYLQNSAAFFQRHYLGNIFVHKITSLF